MKVCKKCNKLLPYSEFYQSKNTKDGYENICKKCRLEARKKYERVCVICGITFKTQIKEAQFCSNRCKSSIRKKDRITTTCAYCGKEFDMKPNLFKEHGLHCCSMDCKNKLYGISHRGKDSPRYNKIEISCDYCGKKFLQNPYQLNHAKRYHFCSKQCQHEKYKEIYSGQGNPTYNPLLDDERRMKKRNIDGYQEWIRQVFKRDNYTCQCCGDNKGHNLNAHHILNYSEFEELRTEIDNGITLCDECHKNFHKTYGYKHNNQNQLNNFINKAMTIPSQDKQKCL